MSEIESAVLRFQRALSYLVEDGWFHSDFVGRHIIEPVSSIYSGTVPSSQLSALHLEVYNLDADTSSMESLGEKSIVPHVRVVTCTAITSVVEQEYGLPPTHYAGLYIYKGCVELGRIAYADLSIHALDMLVCPGPHHNSGEDLYPEGNSTQHKVTVDLWA